MCVYSNLILCPTCNEPETGFAGGVGVAGEDTGISAAGLVIDSTRGANDVAPVSVDFTEIDAGAEV